MKRTEAIEQLQNCIDLIKQDGQDYLDERDIPLLNMAIEALLQCNELVYCWECKYKDGCSQTISLDINNKIINFCSCGERKGGEAE